VSPKRHPAWPAWTGLDARLDQVARLMRCAGIPSETVVRWLGHFQITDAS